MVKSIVIVAGLLLLLFYSTFFLMWNSNTKANVVTLHLGGNPFWLEAVPIGILPLFGALVGALLMAVAAWVPWATQRNAAREAQAKLKKAMERLNEQKQALAARNERIAELEAQLEQLRASGATVDGDAGPAEMPPAPPTPAPTDEVPEGA